MEFLSDALAASSAKGVPPGFVHRVRQSGPGGIFWRAQSSILMLSVS
jgi:hypothetical protein